MSRLRQSIRRRLRHVDSPPLPSSRDLSRRNSPTSGAAAHLPTIPEAPEAAAGSATLGGSGTAAAAVAAGAGGASFEEVDLQQGEAAPGKHPQQKRARRFTSLSCACFAGPLN